MYDVHDATKPFSCDLSPTSSGFTSVACTYYFVYPYSTLLRDQDLGAGFLVASLLFRDTSVVLSYTCNGTQVRSCEDEALPLSI
jgi:hypothetical protein